MTQYPALTYTADVDRFTLEQAAELAEYRAFARESHASRLSSAVLHLRLIFTCCYPALSPEGRVALALRTLCWLSTVQIAAVLLASEPAMAKRGGRRVSMPGVTSCRSPIRTAPSGAASRSPRGPRCSTRRCGGPTTSPTRTGSRIPNAETASAASPSGQRGQR